MTTDHRLAAPPYNPAVELTATRWPKDDIFVACVWVKPRYTVEHVLRLRRMVAQHLSLPHTFVCLTDAEGEDLERLQQAGIGVIEKRYNWPGWWQKIALFDPLSFTAGSVFYLDLDVVVTASLDPFFCTPDPFVAIANFGPNFRHSKYNSSVMLWEPEAGEKVFTEFMDAFPDRVMKKLHGDQCWLWRVMRDDVTVWPRDWVKSYKYEVRNRKGPPAPVVVFHGDPKPDHPSVRNEPWVHAYYTSLDIHQLDE
jgi:hypothetical protein